MQNLLGKTIGGVVCALLLSMPGQPALAGLFDWCCCRKQECCHDRCPECERRKAKEKEEKCSCCCFAKLPPKAEVAFAIPGVARDEAAVRTNFDVQKLQMTAKPEAAKPEAAKPEAAAPCKDPSVEERLTALEDDVHNLADLMSRLANAVEKQNGNP
jgi:hypothetical protein